MCVCFSFFVIDVLSDDTFNGKQITEGCRDAVRACVERSTNSEGRIVEVNAFADFFSKSFGKSYVLKTGRETPLPDCREKLEHAIM